MSTGVKVAGLVEWVNWCRLVLTVTGSGFRCFFMGSFCVCKNSPDVLCIHITLSPELANVTGRRLLLSGLSWALSFWKRQREDRRKHVMPVSHWKTTFVLFFLKPSCFFPTVWKTATKPRSNAPLTTLRDREKSASDNCAFTFCCIPP